MKNQKLNNSNIYLYDTLAFQQSDFADIEIVQK